MQINLISEESYEEGENALDAKINAAGKKKGAFKNPPSNSRILNHPTPSNQPPQNPRIPNHPVKPEDEVPSEPLNFTVGTAFPPGAESNRVQRRILQKLGSKGHQRKSETLSTPRQAEKLRKISSKARQNSSVEIPMGIKINLISEGKLKQIGKALKHSYKSGNPKAVANKVVTGGAGITAMTGIAAAPDLSLPITTAMATPVVASAAAAKETVDGAAERLQRADNIKKIRAKKLANLVQGSKPPEGDSQ